MIRYIEALASIFKKRIKLTSWEEHQVMCSRADGNKLVVEYKDKEPKKTPYTLWINTIDKCDADGYLKYNTMAVPSIIHHELEIGTAKYSNNSAGDEMYCLTTTDIKKTVKHLYFKKELLKSVY